MKNVELPSDSRLAMASDIEQLRDRLRTYLDEAEQLSQCIGFTPEGEPTTRFESELGDVERGIQYVLECLGARLLVYAEALHLPLTRSRVKHWIADWSAKFSETQQWSTFEADGFESSAYNAIAPTLDAFLVLCSAAPPPAADRHEHDHRRLEYCLRSLAKLCREQHKIPLRESDVQKVMHAHLSSVFPDYIENLTIPKPLLKFKPDGGVPSLQAAIECKFVTKKRDVAGALHGILEDLSGYAGSSDWTRFYSVVYMTEPFAAEGQFERALSASGNDSAWTTIVITGPGGKLRGKVTPHLSRSAAPAPPKKP